MLFGSPARGLCGGCAWRAAHAARSSRDCCTAAARWHVCSVGERWGRIGVVAQPAQNRSWLTVSGAGPSVRLRADANSGASACRTGGSHDCPSFVRPATTPNGQSRLNRCAGRQADPPGGPAPIRMAPWRSAPNHGAEPVNAAIRRRRKASSAQHRRNVARAHLEHLRLRRPTRSHAVCETPFTRTPPRACSPWRRLHRSQRRAARAKVATRLHQAPTPSEGQTPDDGAPSTPPGRTPEVNQTSRDAGARTKTKPSSPNDCAYVNARSSVNRGTCDDAPAPTREPTRRPAPEATPGPTSRPTPRAPSPTPHPTPTPGADGRPHRAPTTRRGPTARRRSNTCAYVARKLKRAARPRTRTVFETPRAPAHVRHAMRSSPYRK